MQLLCWEIRQFIIVQFLHIKAQDTEPSNVTVYVSLNW